MDCNYVYWKVAFLRKRSSSDKCTLANSLTFVADLLFRLQQNNNKSQNNTTCQVLGYYKYLENTLKVRICFSLKKLSIPICFASKHEAFFRGNEHR